MATVEWILSNHVTGRVCSMLTMRGSRRSRSAGGVAALAGSVVALVAGVSVGVGLAPAVAGAVSSVDETKLTASDGEEDDSFGWSVGVSGDTIVVGAISDDDNGPSSGSAYVYVPKVGGGYTETKLTASDGDPGDSFGISVGVSGDTIVVGAYNDGDNGLSSGSAYVYESDGAGGYTQTAKLTASDAEGGDRFGWSVGVSGDTIVVGAFRDDDNGLFSGSAYVYESDGAGGYPETAKLTASDGDPGDYFGYSVGVSGDTIIVGALGDDDNGSESGSAYVYESDGAGGYPETAKLTASDAEGGDRFGYSVGVSGDTIVAGAFADDDNGADSGSAYVYVPKVGGGYTETKLTASDAQGGDQFGSSVGVSGDTIVVGAYSAAFSGSAYVYEPDGASGNTETKLTASDGQAYDNFGGSVGVSGDTTVVGAYRDDDNGADSGSVYVYVPATECQPGSFSDTGAEPCTPAPAGSFVATPGATAPTECVAGTFSDAEGATECTPAPAGSFVASPGATAPTECVAGTFQPAAGQTSCEDAPIGTYVDTTGAVAPTDCQAGFTTENTGSASSSDCIPIDTDGDGVPDNEDLCSDTQDDPAPEELKKNRNWPDPTETFGCSPSQIIDDAGLGAGHARFGISNSALADWIATVT